MATITSVGTGNWSTAGTWDAGVPADGDTVVIASGHTVTFDVDQSAWATGLANVTVTGTLKLTRTAGTYCLMLKTADTKIAGAGTFDCGTSVDRIPFTAKHSIQNKGGNGCVVDGASGLICTVYGTEPTYLYARLSGAEASGQTRLEINTDLTGDIWADGDTIAVVNINDAQEVEYRVIADITSTYIDITVGLTASKLAGSYVVLITRNVRFDSRIFGLFRSMSAKKLDIGGGGFNNNGAAYGYINTSVSPVVSGGVFYENNAQYALFRGTSNVVITGGAFVGGGKTQYGSGLFDLTGCVVSGGLFAGIDNVFGSASSGIITGGIFAGCNAVIRSIVGVCVAGGTFIGNKYMLYTTSAKLYNITFDASVEHYLYTSMYEHDVAISENHDGSTGGVKAWCKGGVVTSQTSVKPTGYAQAYLLDPESATYPVFWYKTFTVAAGETINVEVQLRKDGSMTYLPRVYLMNSIENPLVDATAAEDSFTMTDSTDTWESDTFTIDNSAGTTDLDYTLWFVAKNASGNAYSAYKITRGGGGGGLLTNSGMTGGMRG